MNPCDTCQNKLLDHLYGLLDEAESAAVTEHLGGCAACQAALAAAQGQRQLLTVAARAEFPSVRFEPPAVSAPVAVPESLPLLQPAPARRAWRRWALAASILLVLGGMAGVAGLSWKQHHDEFVLAQARLQEASRQRDELAQVRATEETRLQEEKREVQAEIMKLEKTWNEDLTKVQKEFADKQLRVRIVGPRTLEAGARNEYRVETRRAPMPGAAQAPPAPSTIDFSVVDPKTHAVYYKNSVASRGECVLVLPSDLPAKPGRQLALEVTARADTGAQARVTEQLPLIGTLYLTHLTTDLPMYRPGEVVRFRSLTLERFSLKPAKEEFALVYTISDPTGAELFKIAGKPLVTAGKGQRPLKGPDGKELHGIGCGEFAIPPTASGGEYTLTVGDVLGRFPVERRKFLVNRYQAPRLNKELEFTRKSYGPGDAVEARCKVSLVEGGKPVVNQAVIATAQVDGKAVAVENGGSLRTDATGKVPAIRFHLPGEMERGIGTLAVQLTDGANHETIVRPIPIILKKLFVDFYPEGGDLVAGVPNRVYFQARTNLNKPAEIHGRIVDQAGNVAAAVQTLSDDTELGVNQGMGLCQFVPALGKTYELKIDVPLGIEGRYTLPAVKADGVVLGIPHGVVKDRIDVNLYTGRTPRKLLVGAYCRGRVLQTASTTVQPGAPAHVTLTPSEGAGGVYRVTVFEERGAANGQLVPVAERLIYRRPVRHLEMNLRTDKKSYSPGAPVTVTVTAMNEKEKKVPAVILLSVVNQGIVKLADEKTARSMPAHFLLTTEIKKPEDLEYADFLLSDHPKAEAALDLLLGTQGWRRFAEQDPAQFRQQQKQDAERLLVANGQSVPAMHDSVETGLARVDAKFTPLHEAKEKELARFEAREEQDRKRSTAALAQVQGRISLAQRAVRDAESNYRDHSDRLLRGGLATLAALLLVIGLGGVIVGLIRSSQEQRHAVPYLLTGFCALLLLLLGGSAGILWYMGMSRERAEDRTMMAAAKQASAPLPPERRAGGQGEFTGKDVRPEDREEKAGEKQLNENRNRADGAVRLGIEQGVAPVPKNAPAPPPGAIDEAWEAGQMVRPDVQDKLINLGARRGEGPAKMKKEPLGNLDLQNLAQQVGGQPGQGGQNQFAPFFNAPMGAPGPVPFAGGMPANMNGGFGGMMGMMGMPGNQGGRGPQMAGVGGMGMGGFNGNFGWLNPQQEQALRQQNRFKDIAMLRMGRPIPVPPPLEPFVVREYAHRHVDSPDHVRRDFTETVCWQPVLVLADGKGQVSFDLPDSVTRFEVVAWGHTLDGRLGAAKMEFASRLPFSVEPKVPTEVTHTDKVVIPVTVANGTDKSRAVKLTAGATNLKLQGPANLDLAVGPEQRLRKLFTFTPAVAQGEARLTFNGRCDPFGLDSVERSFKVVAEGFPFNGSHSDLLEGTAQNEVILPDNLIPGTLQVQAQVFPSTLADLQKGLEAMLREPGGCFEQTSSSNYPNVLILSYLKESDQALPKVEKRARQMLTNGYRLLTSYECQAPAEQVKRRGYEWFGGTAPPHEALTAYGLLEFRDMARVHPVDQVMLERTRKYLLAQRDGSGGFKRNPRALDSFGAAPQHITNAYIVWALTEAGGNDDLEVELDALTKQAQTSKDPYFLALVGNSLINKARTRDGVDILKRLATMQQADGRLVATETSITHSGGRELEIETTALATLAWLKANRPADFNDNVQKAVKWIGTQRGGFGGFGATQSTILALKALIAYTRENRRTAEAGELRLYVNDGKEPVAVQAFAAGTKDAVVVRVPREDMLHKGKNTIRLEMTGKKNHFPYTLAWSYNTLKPANPEGCPVHLTAKLDRASASEGETVRLTATVENKTGKGQGMAVAILGLPGGLALPEDMKQLKEMARLRDNDTKPGLISAWEVRGRELVLYWRDLAPDQKIDVSVDLICRIPGEYRGPASRAYLYYNSDRKFWTEPLSIAVRPQQ
jgi:hypothetical protein